MSLSYPERRVPCRYCGAPPHPETDSSNYLCEPCRFAYYLLDWPYPHLIRPISRRATRGQYEMVSVGNGKLRPKHRLVLEQRLGRPLSRDEVVHHLDGNAKNNDVANLVIMDASTHIRLHGFCHAYKKLRDFDLVTAALLRLQWFAQQRIN
jgi:hypothetical protein